MNESIDADIAKKEIASLLQQCVGILCSEAIREVQHYVEHGEPEMAFEGLFIELIEVGKIPKSVDKVSCLQLGVYLKLDVESVLDDAFWMKFNQFLEAESEAD